MLLSELFLQEYRTSADRSKVGQAVSDIIKAVAGGIPGLMSINPTDRQAAVNDLAEKWDKEFEKILKKDRTARDRYGVEFKKWVEANYNIDNIADKIDISKTVANNKPNKTYIFKVLNVIFNKAQEEKKKGVKFGANKSKDYEIGAIGTGSDGKKYVWKGMQWATQDTNAIKRKDVTVTPD
jgi:hypothetical protein